MRALALEDANFFSNAVGVVNGCPGSRPSAHFWAIRQRHEQFGCIHNVVVSQQVRPRLEHDVTLAPGSCLGISRWVDNYLQPEARGNLMGLKVCTDTVAVVEFCKNLLEL